MPEPVSPSANADFNKPAGGAVNKSTKISATTADSEKKTTWEKLVEFYEFLYGYCVIEYDPYGPDAERQLEAWRLRMSKRGNCPLYCFITCFFAVPGLIMGIGAGLEAARCRVTRDECIVNCTLAWEQRLEKMRTSAERFSVKGQTEQAELCEEGCIQQSIQCIRPTFLMLGAAIILVLALCGVCCLTGIFENVREQAKREAQKAKMTGQDASSKRKPSKRKISKDMDAVVELPPGWDSGAGLPDVGNEPGSPTSPKSAKSFASFATSVASTNVFVKGAKKCCATFADCFDFVIVQPIQEKLMEWKKKYILHDDPNWTWSVIQCPTCETEVEVKGVDQASLKVGFFEEGWDLPRSGAFCPFCKTMISGVL